ncbi:helix-turn-helix transcriptional regulator [Streptomyces sp. NBC_01007]|nr:helix-turn-helix transcriptional regulator [Streptomyces sp. NBC_01007]
MSILRRAADGDETGEIADRLGYSERTIKRDLHELMKRLGLRNRAHAVAYALRAGYL